MSQATSFPESLLFLLPFTALSLASSAVTGDARSVVATEAQNGQDLQIGTNDVLIVRLQAQAGTGYSWTVTTAPPFLRLSQEHTEPAGRTIPGGAEVQLFTFKPIGSGDV
jgi:predicted secreted protein